MMATYPSKHVDNLHQNKNNCLWTLKILSCTYYVHYIVRISTEYREVSIQEHCHYLVLLPYIHAQV